ncbi:hypothetical protein SAMN04488515_2193 [Cognatiyoonia koreensis]|uniref:Uncharacterized protein n=1 Tax=Cognatiyoonia koreensis TaxID=364200 RepID=A0A1I0QTQ8_9RHOB|nr:hypothetical protein [Cognatiyoonia koreensis]SEW30963.1 hypothetical protein SAMN04488515_2193 [Cognatiyoonia koreensis]
MKKLIPLLMLAAPAFAEPVTVLDVTATPSGDTWRFDVTVEHPDTGWDHYADGWRVEDADGNELGMRVLAHPHVNEQPFTRSLSGVVIPQDVNTVYVRARDLVDGWNADTTPVTLER